MSAQERARTGLPAHVVHERHPLRHEWKQHSGDMREGRWSHTEAIGAKPASRNCHAAAATATMLVEATPCACESPCTARQGGGQQEGGGACAQLSMGCKGAQVRYGRARTLSTMMRKRKSPKATLIMPPEPSRVVTGPAARRSRRWSRGEPAAHKSTQRDKHGQQARALSRELGASMAVPGDVRVHTRVCIAQEERCTGSHGIRLALARRDGSARARTQMCTRRAKQRAGHQAMTASRGRRCARSSLMRPTTHRVKVEETSDIGSPCGERPEAKGRHP